MKVLVLFFALLAVIYAASGNSVQFYCGRRLSEALAYLCPKEEFEKRSFNVIPDYDEYSWSLPALPKARALEGVRGKRQGVATECCEKACTLSELLSYC